MTHNITWTLQTLEDTKRCAELIANHINDRSIIILRGNLGAGKTCFAKYFIHHLSGELVDDITSPTFNLLQTYESPKGTIFHYDLYRLESEDELYELGFEESLSQGICLIEWPEIASSFLPNDIMDLEFDYQNEIRSLLLRSNNEKFINILAVER